MTHIPNRPSVHRFNKWHIISLLQKHVENCTTRIQVFNMTPIITNNTIDTILNTYRLALGKNFEPYRNHVYRVYNFAVTTSNSKKDLEKLAIVAAFHDIGIWTNNTFDYLEPSAKLAREYCRKQNLSFYDINDVAVMINNHHKLSKVESSALAEIFREADLIDLTLGLVQKGRKRDRIRLIRNLFPNKGFHLFLVKLFFKNLITNPIHPFPIFKL